MEDGQELSERLCATGVDVLLGREQLEGLLELLIRSRELGMRGLEALVFGGEVGKLDLEIPGVLLLSLTEGPLGSTVLSSSPLDESLARVLWTVAARKLTPLVACVFSGAEPTCIAMEVRGL